MKNRIGFTRISSNRFFEIYGKKRKTLNEFTELGNAIDEFKDELYKLVKARKILDWLAKRLK